MNDEINNFNLRVYGLLIRNQKILISKEHFRGRELIKYPGGGLEYGEGIEDCLHREWREETGMTIRINRLYYITDYFIQSAFCPQDQIVSFYYLIESEDAVPTKNLEHYVEWFPLKNPDSIEPGFTFAQDKKVFELLQTSHI